MATKYRRDRINSEVAHTVGEIVRNVKDPRVSGGFVTITGADVTADLKYAKIFFGCISGDSDEIGNGLADASGYIRSELAHRLNLRITPELTFYYDDSAVYGSKIANILKELNINDEK